jgi:hypothetical protein
MMMKPCQIYKNKIKKKEKKEKKKARVQKGTY